MCPKSTYALHPISQKFPQQTFETVSNVRLIDDGPLSSFQGRSSSASSFHVPLLQPIDGVMFLALCQQVVSQASQHFRSSENLYGLLCLPIYLLGHSLHSGMSRAAYPQKVSKVGVDRRHIPVWASHSTVHFFFFLASSLHLWGWWHVGSDYHLLRQSSGRHGWLLPPPLSSRRLRPYKPPLSSRMVVAH